MCRKRCTPSRVDAAALSDASRHRHDCRVLRRVCLFNGTLVPAGSGRAAASAAAVAASLQVRNIFGSHQSFPLSTLHPLLPPPPASPSAALLAREIRAAGFSACLPLVWLPVWAFSFADTFVSSVVPLFELRSAGLIDAHVLLRPDLSAWPRARNPAYQMAQALSSAPLVSLREAAPKCFASRRRRCVARCYERLLVCQFRSTFDAYAPPMRPWAAAQAVAAASRGRRGERKAAGWKVLFVNRTNTKFSRSLVNLDSLLRHCARWLAGGSCAAHEFGRHGLRADVEQAEAADVLVGTHGAGLTNAFFMRQGSAVVEVRPYGFEGAWPDHYFKELSALEHAVFYFQVTSGDPELSVPAPRKDVSVWDARDHGVRLPWRTLREVLASVVAVNHSRSQYLDLLRVRGHATFVSKV
ncbi:hypothetical protein AB1Y20_008828 [Prymnesium parvum]|uniref:Glycosyltransferase 61 catalytic domain-containing protein n=1 Tax=Prymnesium parvum TaxID=97485 RepID=A0AB34IU99_PRYPA